MLFSVVAFCFLNFEFHVFLMKKKTTLDKCWAKKLLLTHSLESKIIKNRKKIVETDYPSD